jgi:hypothetical protein
MALVNSIYKPSVAYPVGREWERTSAPFHDPKKGWDYLAWYMEREVATFPEDSPVQIQLVERISCEHFERAQRENLGVAAYEWKLCLIDGGVISAYLAYGYNKIALLVGLQNAYYKLQGGGGASLPYLGQVEAWLNETFQTCYEVR